jgi:hypothetical protein
VLVNAANGTAASNGDEEVTALCALNCIGFTDNELVIESATRFSSATELFVDDEDDSD